MRNVLLAVLLLFSCAFAQDVAVGEQGVTVGIPLDTKLIDVGFRNYRMLNVSTVNKTNHLLLRWSKPALVNKTVARYEVRYGFPKCFITAKDFGLVSLDSSLALLRNNCMNFVSPVEVQEETSYLLRVSGFDIVFQVIAMNSDGGIVAISQIRYVRQKR